MKRHPTIWITAAHGVISRAGFIERLRREGDDLSLMTVRVPDVNHVFEKGHLRIGVQEEEVIGPLVTPFAPERVFCFGKRANASPDEDV